MLQEHHLDLGEIHTQGVGGNNEDWWSLIFDTSTGELLLHHSWSYMSGPRISDSDESLTLVRELDPASQEFQWVVQHLQNCIAQQ